MTAPLTPEALVESLSAFLAARFSILKWQADAHAVALLAGPLVPIIADAAEARAAHQQVTAERDEARSIIEGLARDLAKERVELARLRAEGEALKRKRDMAADLVVSLCDSVLGNAYLGKEGEEELAVDLKRLFTRIALARAATAREG